MNLGGARIQALTAYFSQKSKITKNFPHFRENTEKSAFRMYLERSKKTGCPGISVCLMVSVTATFVGPDYFKEILIDYMEFV